jgi:hypothetical protein
MHRQFRVNGIQGIETHIEILNEVSGGFETRITSINTTGIRESIEFMSDELLESCIRTGYLEEEAVDYEVLEAVLTA